MDTLNTCSPTQPMHVGSPQLHPSDAFSVTVKESLAQSFRVVSDEGGWDDVGSSQHEVDGILDGRAALGSGPRGTGNASIATLVLRRLEDIN